MSYIFTFLTGLLIGTLGGILVYRKNSERLKETEAKGKSILDAIRGK